MLDEYDGNVSRRPVSNESEEVEEGIVEPVSPNNRQGNDAVNQVSIIIPRQSNEVNSHSSGQD